MHQPAKKQPRIEFLVTSTAQKGKLLATKLTIQLHVNPTIKDNHTSINVVKQQTCKQDKLM